MAKTILIADDDPTQRRLIQAVLEREGFGVVHAENGAQAYDRLSGGKPLMRLSLIWSCRGSRASIP